MLLALGDGKLTATRLADVAGDGRALVALEVKGQKMRPTTLLFDPASGLLVRERYVTPSGKQAEEEYSDYRDVRGLKVAFRTRVSYDGVVVLERTVRSFEYNVPLDAAVFNKPS
jgi:hypothetical protein